MTNYYSLKYILAIIVAIHVYQLNADSPLEITKNFDIPAQSLSGALLEFSNQSGFDLLATDIPDTNQSVAIKGNYSLEVALQLLLASDNFEIELHGNSILLKKKLQVNNGDARYTNNTLVTKGKVEEVVVKGIRASLAHSLNRKKSNDYLSEVTTQEDVGKFPDANVVDSLQRTTGAAITRTRGGEGQFISVRGLGQQFNIVTYNGRVLPTDNVGTEFSFDVLPSEIISEAKIVKSPTASLEEGSIGALIDMITPQPFDNKGFHFTANYGKQYDDLAEAWGNKFSMFSSNTFNDDTLGASIGIIYSSREWRADMAQSLGYGFKNIDVNNNGTIEQNEKNLYMPLYSAYALKSGNRQRLGVVSSIQFEPSTEYTSTLDFLYSDYKTPEMATYQTNNFDQIFAEDSSYKFKPGSFVVNNRGSVTHFAVDNYPAEVAVDPKNREVITWQIGWKNNLVISDTLSLNSDISYAFTNRPEAGKDKFWVAGIKNAQAEYNSHVPVPEVKVTIPGGRTIDEARPDETYVGFLKSQGDTIRDKITSIKLEANYSIQEDYVSSLVVGVSLQGRSKERMATANVDCAYCGFPFNFSDVNITPTIKFPGNNFLAGYSGDFPRTWPNLDVNKVYSAAQTADGNIINPVTNKVYPENYSKRLIPYFNSLASSKIDENLINPYLQMNLLHSNWRANIGVRMASTEIYSSGEEQEILAIREIPNSSNSEIDLSNAKAIAHTNNSLKILPSANIYIDIDEDVILRSSLAYTMSRPTLSQLGFDETIEGNSGLKRITHNGNPELKPIMSTQGDIGLEWYASSRNFLSIDTFYKKIYDFVSNSYHNEVILGYVFQVEEPKNVQKIDVYGIEFGGQYFLNNKFGIQVNYSYADTANTIAKNSINYALENLSKNSWNTIFIYEDENYEFRLSTNYRSHYFQSAVGQGGRPETVDNYMQTDFKISYNLSGCCQLYMDGINIFGAYKYVYSDYPERLVEFEQFGRRFSLGIRYAL